ncbi:MAG: N-acetylmuramoyl-L-alanine amidase [bacterium]|nr:MAG: N-acetylmuramoyl-L-alanine amidase [bacterium]
MKRRSRYGIPRARTAAWALLASVLLALPAAGISADLPQMIRFSGPGIAGSLRLAGDMVDLASLMEAFGLRSSMDLMGDRMDIVGEGGSCRLLMDSPLILSRGLFTVLSGPVRSMGGNLALPLDFLTKGLPTLTGRDARFDPGASSLALGEKGSASFKGSDPDDLVRYASFIRRDQYVPEEKLREEPKGLSVVVLDPGHGGRSIGAQGSTGTLEKDLVLSVSEKLKRELEEGLGVKVVLTRTADYYVGLKERTAIANNNRADLFISIHANATFRREIEGFETYYLNFRSSDKEAGRYAEMENRALGVKGGADEEALLEAILWDMAQTSFLAQSSELASMVQDRLVKNVRGSDRGVRQAPLAVLMGARMPAALVEIGFISNPEQEVRLNRESYQAQIARSLYEAIEDYHRGLLRGEIKRGTD